MNFEKLNLAPGYALQLQLQNQQGQQLRYQCKLIGYLQGKTLLVTLPRAGGKAARLMGGQKLMAKLMVANGICLFNTSVEGLSTSPYPILHLSYPSSVSFKGIRSATRVEVKLPIKVCNQSDLEGAECAGIIADISTTGARIELEQELANVGDELLIKAEAVVAERRRKLEFSAVVRSRIERSTREYDQQLPAVYGLEFTIADDLQKLLLHAYVYCEMADEDKYSQE